MVMLIVEVTRHTHLVMLLNNHSHYFFASIFHTKNGVDT